MTNRWTTPALLAAICLLSIGCAGLPDLRPESVLDGVSAQEEARGRALLDRAAELAGGKELILEHDGFRATFQDVWADGLPKLLFLRYDERQRIEVVAKNPNVTDVRMTLLDGERAGEVWGLEDNRVYIDRGEGKEFTDDGPTMLYIKNPAALVLVGLRLAWADKVAYTGPVTHDGKRYETIFLSWETFEPNERFDQWHVWIDPETGHIARAHLTVRELGGGLVTEGALAFGGWRRHGDVVVPTTIAALPSIDGDAIRTYNLESFDWTDSPVETAAPESRPSPDTI